MREILFRGKKHSDGQWILGDLNQWLEAIYISAENSDGYTKTNWLVDAATIGQFTGLTAKNGKIFEGDIVKLTDKHYETEWTAQVVFGNPYAEYSWGWNFYYIGEKPQVNTDVLLWVEMEDLGVYCEVIGNIHDNPELIGGVDNG